MAIKICSVHIVFLTFFLAFHFHNVVWVSNAAREIYIDMVVASADNTVNAVGKVATYWGRDSRERSLADTCTCGNYDFVIISFLSSFGNNRAPVLSLSGHCDPSNGGCQSLSNDIQICQRQGVKVLVSLGGPPGGYALTAVESQSVALADYLWNTFLGGVSTSRPFGPAVLDGIDFDIRGGILNYPPVVRRLSSYSTSIRKVYITGSSPCLTWPTAIRRFGGAYDTGVVDYAFVHFYDVYENLQSCEYDAANVTAFRAAWNLWGTLPVRQIFFGALASIEAGSSGYISPDVLESEILPFVKGTPKYGGVMVWNNYFDEQSGFTAAIRPSL